MEALVKKSNKYSFSFEGRQMGAIGITYKINESYLAADIHEAMSLLYADYNLIHSLIVKSGAKEIEVPKEINWKTVRSYTTRKRDLKTGIYI